MSRPLDKVVALLILRHAHAGDSLTWDKDDSLRPLTERGRRQADRVGRLLAAAGFVPDIILTSPLVRARQTAEIVAGILGLETRDDDRLGDLVDLPTLERILHDAGDPRQPMVVGHDPDLSELVSELVGAPVAMRKGSLARIDVELPLTPGAGDLRWLAPPDLLRG